MLLPLDLAAFDRSQQLAKALLTRGLHELRFDASAEQRSLLELATMLAHPGADAMAFGREVRFAGVVARPLPGAELAQTTELLDPEVFVADQLELAVGVAARLLTYSNQPWPWPLGLTCIRHLERCFKVGPVPLLRAVELAPGEWSVARRAVAAAVNTGVALEVVEAGPIIRKVASHAVMALCVHGLRLTGAIDQKKAASVALEAVLPVKGGKPMEPHKSMVCALLHRLSGDHEKAAKPGLAPLLSLAFRMEAMRVPVGERNPLALADLVSVMLQNGRSVDRNWLTALLHTSGVFPPGTRVKLSDGQVGLVLGPADHGDQLRPKVLAEGHVVVPAMPVMPLPPL